MTAPLPVSVGAGPALAFRDVSLVRGGVRLLDGVSFDIAPGERRVLFGQNGAGKSLLLQIAAGYLGPTTGEVLRFGLHPLGQDIRELRKRIGYLHAFVKDTLAPSEPVLDLVAAGAYATIGGFYPPTDEEIEKARALLDIVGAGRLADSPFGRLSDGEKERVLVARAVMPDPDLVILDEPASNLDYAGRERLLDAVAALCESRPELAALMVTHRVDDIIGVFHSLMILKAGRVTHEGDIDSLLNSDIIGEAIDLPVRVFKEYDRYWCVVRK